MLCPFNSRTPVDPLFCRSPATRHVFVSFALGSACEAAKTPLRAPNLPCSRASNSLWLCTRLNQCPNLQRQETYKIRRERPPGPKDAATYAAAHLTDGEPCPSTPPAMMSPHSRVHNDHTRMGTGRPANEVLLLRMVTRLGTLGRRSMSSSRRVKSYRCTKISHIILRVGGKVGCRGRGRMV